MAIDSPKGPKIIFRFPHTGDGNDEKNLVLFEHRIKNLDHRITLEPYHLNKSMQAWIITLVLSGISQEELQIKKIELTNIATPLHGEYFYQLSF